MTDVLRDLRAPATDETDGVDATDPADGPGVADGNDDADDEAERFLLADPDDPVVYVYEIPADGTLEHVDTLPLEATEAGTRPGHRDADQG